MIICPLEERDFQHVCAVIVSSDGVNACGHTLLHINGSWSWYVHISGFYKAPKFILERGYKRYLNENGKREIRRWIVKVPNPEAAHQKLLETLVQKWPWYLVYNNCASFVEVVLEAGGSKAGMYFNCPTVEPFA